MNLSNSDENFVVFKSKSDIFVCVFLAKQLKTWAFQIKVPEYLRLPVVSFLPDLNWHPPVCCLSTQHVGNLRFWWLSETNEIILTALDLLLINQHNVPVLAWGSSVVCLHTGAAVNKSTHTHTPLQNEMNSDHTLKNTARIIPAAV